MTTTTTTEYFFRVYLTRKDAEQPVLLHTTGIGDREAMLAGARGFAHDRLSRDPGAALTIQEFEVVPGENVTLH